MSYMRHDVIVAYTHDRRYAEAAHAEISAVLHCAGVHENDEPGLWLELLTPIAETPVNGDFTFAFLPDGSKEGWPDSNEGDRLRGEIRAILSKDRKSFRTPDLTFSPFTWFEARVGSEEREIISSHDEEEE